MKAFALSAFDTAATLQELPVPEVGSGHARIRVRAASLNGIDAAISSGMVKDYAEYDFPVIIGRDAAGIVDAVGDGVEDVAEGDEGIGHVLWGPRLHEGTLAEYAVVPSETVVAKPSSLEFAEAAALPLAGTAALGVVEAVDPKPGETVLIAGASGGVGSFAVQLAAARGATVIGTGLPSDVDRLRKLGAATVVDYREDIAAQIAGRPVDSLIDLVSFDDGTFDRYAGLLREGGRVASTTSAATPEAVAARGLTGGTVMAAPSRDTLTRLLDAIQGGTLRVDVEQTFPLAEAASVLETFVTGHTSGKLVVAV